ncbi:hypothetical protein [Lysinibacillus odysseyi]|uniref:Lipoprotein n=1 Tax=Lysinibacillus odysseyi 34hs-1 = NBRC 100172 TaxID=1220589 RepID=A0A0A3IFA8_9BACI|nr:hypothetical protein [Lysinibacillus odysseyi]KGR82155.1 hypothetical protein CD32_23010 [Lysinibacillus odysseyi 34hs-1 = NBRC 100172]
MDTFFKRCIALLFVFLLTGCIGEDYDFSPPTVTVFTPNGTNNDETLTEANIDWSYDEKYNKETKDIQSLAIKQNVIYFNAGELVAINFEDGDYHPDGIHVSLWQGEKKIDLEYQKSSQDFYLPKEKGEYILVVDIDTNHNGSAQYVGNIVIR